MDYGLWIMDFELLLTGSDKKNKIFMFFLANAFGGASRRILRLAPTCLFFT
jgi:hypothetical protein